MRIYFVHTVATSVIQTLDFPPCLHGLHVKTKKKRSKTASLCIHFMKVGKHRRLDFDYTRIFFFFAFLRSLLI